MRSAGSTEAGGTPSRRPRQLANQSTSASPPSRWEAPRAGEPRTYTVAVTVGWGPTGRQRAMGGGSRSRLPRVLRTSTAGADANGGDSWGWRCVIPFPSLAGRCAAWRAVGACRRGPGGGGVGWAWPPGEGAPPRSPALEGRTRDGRLWGVGAGALPLDWLATAPKQLRDVWMGLGCEGCGWREKEIWSGRPAIWGRGGLGMGSLAAWAQRGDANCHDFYPGSHSRGQRRKYRGRRERGKRLDRAAFVGHTIPKSHTILAGQRAPTRFARGNGKPPHCVPGGEKHPPGGCRLSVGPKVYSTLSRLYVLYSTYNRERLVARMPMSDLLLVLSFVRHDRPFVHWMGPCDAEG